MVVTDTLRDTCAWIAARSTHVNVVEDAIAPYAASYVRDIGVPPAVTEGQERPAAAPNDPPAPAPVATPATEPSPSGLGVARETEAAYWLTLDAINFGSGWFPTLRKRREPTGYRTVAGGVRRRFDEAGRWTPAQLTTLTATELAGWIDQEPEHELVGLMVASLHDLGENVLRLYGGSFAAVVDHAGGSALRLVETLAVWRSFDDISIYDGRAVPFMKRAQIAAADLDRAGVADFTDLDRLTMFADNLVPHVLRIDGVLWFDPELVARIDREELIEHGSPEEIEIRACTVHAVELIVAAMKSDPAHPTAAQIDERLWNRGQQPKYKAVPRHRSRSTAY